MPLPAWKIHASRYVFEREPYIKVRRDDCEIKSGQIIDYYITERPDFALVVALTPNGQVPLVRQYRLPPQTAMLELPSGILHPREDPQLAALRELREETGFIAHTAELLGVWWESPAISTTRAFCYLATDVQTLTAPELDDAEEIEVELHDFAQLASAVSRGEIISDGISVAAILMAAQRLRLER